MIPIAKRTASRRSPRPLSDQRARSGDSDVVDLLAPPGAELSVQDRMELARQALEVDAPHHALRHLEAVDLVAPDLPGLAKAFGCALVGVGMMDVALAKLEQAVAADPGDRECWRLLAAVRRERGDYEGCSAAWSRAMMPGSDDAAGGASRSAPSGSQATRPCLERVPGNSTVGAGADGSRKGSEREPSRSPGQVLRLADALLRAGSVLNAEKLYARQLQSSLAAQAYLGLARCACARGQYWEALPHLRAAQRLQPDHQDLRPTIDALLAAMAGER